MSKKQPKMNRMSELAMQDETFRKNYRDLNGNRYLVSSNNPEGFTQEDLRQLSEWARNQRPIENEEEGAGE